MIKTQFIEKNKGAESLTDIQIISQAIVFIIAGKLCLAKSPKHKARRYSL